MKNFFRNLVFLLFALPLFWTAALQAEAKETTNVIPQGIFVEDIDVSGMTGEEAAVRIREYVTSLENEKVIFHVSDKGQVDTTIGELGLTWSNEAIIEEACSYGKKGNIIQRYKELKDLQHENKRFAITFDVSQEAISTFLTEQCSTYTVEAVDAQLKRENGAFTIEAGQTGYEVNIAESTQEVYSYFTTQWNHEACEIDLIAEVTEPRGTKEDLSKVKDVLGTFTTSYSTSGAARSKNVSNGCSLINATTLYPGDSFSAYEEVSPFTEENGYYMAGSYLNGMVVDSLGGGICQVTTTLYNAVLRAELEVTERYNHSMIVSYVDPSSDAAISGTSKDFKFTNSLDTPIYIEGITKDKQIIFTVYGAETRPANRKVEYVSEVLQTTNPTGEKIIQDAALPVGSIDVQSAHIGYVAKLWKVVTEDGAEVSRTEVNKSNYQVSPRTATIGVSTSDPNVYTAMQAAIATGSIDHVKSVVAAYNAAQAAGPVLPPAEAPIVVPDANLPIEGEVIP